MRHIIREIYVYMLIIGKISDVDPSFINTVKNNAPIGDQGLLFHHIRMGAVMSINVQTHMDGKNKNIILSHTSWIRVGMVIHVLKCTVHIIILIRIGVLKCHNGLRFSLKLGLLTFLQIIICHIWEMLLVMMILWVEWNKLHFQELQQKFPFPKILLIDLKHLIARMPHFNNYHIKTLKLSISMHQHSFQVVVVVARAAAKGSHVKIPQPNS